MTPVIYRDTSEKQPYNLLDGVVYERRHLLVADYASAAQCVRVKANTWMPRFGIERKAGRDWLSSWHGKTKANGYRAGAGEEKKMITAKAYSKELGYTCRFAYVLDCNLQALREMLRREPWRRKDLTTDDVIANINRIRLAGYHVILCQNKLIAEMQSMDLIRQFDAKYGPVQEWKGAE